MSSKNTKKRSSRKPKVKAQYCMEIQTKGSISENRDVIENFVRKLYSKKKYTDPFSPEEILVILDTRGKRVCVDLGHKIIKNYLRLEDIHEQIKPKDLRIKGTDIVFSPPEPEVLEHHITQKKIKMPKGYYWMTLQHNGPYFTWIQEPYEAHGAPIRYAGKDYKLTPPEEEVANFWAKRITTDETSRDQWTKDAVFRKNFWRDFKKYLTPEHKKVFKDFNKLDFEKIRKKLIQMKENETAAEKRKKKKKSAERKYEYGFAIINGIKEPIGNFTIEPASLFLGRGKNKIRGSIKRHITPNEVTINIGKDARAPTPPKGYKWKKVVHDHKARWLMKWKDSLTGSMKYVYMSAEGQFKSASDAAKFEKSRKLNRYIDDVRRGYQKSINSSDMTKRQLGTVMYLIDHYGLRVGGANDDSTADTFGASTLLVGHTKLIPPNKIHLNFLGKDSIEYDKIMEVTPEVYRNIKDFLRGKSKKSDLFDRINACDINNYLKSFDKDLSAKVFRTRLGSHLMYNALKKVKIPKSANQSQKKFAFDKANVEIAKALNHQKSVAKGAEATLKKYKQQLKDWKEELKIKKKGNRSTKSLEERIRKKKAAIELKEVGKTISTTTSKQNYIDPRLVVAWAKANEMDIKGAYTSTMQRKFRWAIDTTPPKWDYEKTPLLPDFEELQPDIQSGCPLPSPKGKRPKRPTRKRGSSPLSSSSSEDEEGSSSEDEEESSSEDEEEEPLVHLGRKKLLAHYGKLLKRYGYVMVKDGNFAAIQRVGKIPLSMRLSAAYADIYELSEKMLKDGSGYLAMILIGEVCRDARKHESIKKAFVRSGYVDKYKKIVKQAL